MATKRTKADKEQRQSEQLEKKSERRPETITRKLPEDSAERPDSTTNPAR